MELSWVCRELIIMQFYRGIEIADTKFEIYRPFLDKGNK